MRSAERANRNVAGLLTICRHKLLKHLSLQAKGNSLASSGRKQQSTPSNHFAYFIWHRELVARIRGVYFTKKLVQ
jgi:hypothetical protein